LFVPWRSLVLPLQVLVFLLLLYFGVSDWIILAFVVVLALTMMWGRRVLPARDDDDPQDFANRRPWIWALLLAVATATLAAVLVEASWQVVIPGVLMFFGVGFSRSRQSRHRRGA
jgi:O-antigen ligase